MDTESARVPLEGSWAKEVPICDIDPRSSLLIGSDGKAYHEVATNLWVAQGEDVAYLGTGRHGGGIVLRAMFSRVGDEWFNINTGAKATFEIVARGASDCLEGVYVLDQLDEKERLEAVASICDAFSWADKMGDVYQNLCRCLGGLFCCHEVHMYLMNDDCTDLLKCASYTGEESTVYDRKVLSAKVGRIEWMKETRRPIIMDYEHPDPHDEIPVFALERGMLSGVSIPIIVDAGVMGLISLAWPFKALWRENDLVFLDTAGKVVGTLVERLNDTKKAAQLQVLRERKLLSTEIHENISSLVGALSVNAAAALESYKVDDLDSMALDLQRLETAASKVMRTLRDEMLSLRISLENTNGLIAGIEESLRQFEESWGIRTELVVDCDEVPVVVPLNVSLQLTRILNESLSNVLRHAQATEIAVRVAQNDESVVMTVRDNGIGFDEDAVEPGHFGVLIMRERAANAGGALTISSGVNGTCVRVCVPKAWRSSITGQSTRKAS